MACGVQDGRKNMFIRQYSKFLVNSIVLVTFSSHGAPRFRPGQL